MNAKQKLAAEFVELLKQQRKEHNERGRFLGYAERLAARIRLCGICGSWVGNGTTYSMLVSPQEDSLSVLNSLSVLICDNSHCYKTVLRDLSAVLRDRQIVLVGELGQSCGRIILDENDVLHCRLWDVPSGGHAFTQRTVRYAKRRSFRKRGIKEWSER